MLSLMTLMIGMILSYRTPTAQLCFDHNKQEVCVTSISSASLPFGSSFDAKEVDDRYRLSDS